MTLFVHVMMIAWLPVVLALFALLPPRRAVLVGFIAGWLFLPVAEYRIPNIPDYTKYAACSLAVLAGVLGLPPGPLLPAAARLTSKAIFGRMPLVSYFTIGADVLSLAVTGGAEGRGSRFG